MSESGLHSHKPFGASGSGHYGKFNDNTEKVTLLFTEQVVKTLATIPVDVAKPFAICDYGCADSSTFMPVATKIISQQREKYGDELPIQVFYEDQPFNDFNSVVLRTHGLIPGGPKPYIDEFANVYAYDCGLGFYSQCFPANTLSLGYCAIAGHWSSKRACIIPDEVFYIQSKDETVKEKFRQQGAKDWETFLTLRAKELKPGGVMMMIMFARDKDGHYSHKGFDEGKFSVYDILPASWKDMLNEGLITEEEYREAGFNMYYRNEEEFSAPLKDKDSPVFKEGLELISIETKVMPDPTHEKFFKTGAKAGSDEAKQFANFFTNGTRRWTNFTFLGALSASRTAKEKEDIVDELYRRYEEAIAKDPYNSGADFVYANIVMQKKK